MRRWCLNIESYWLDIGVGKESDQFHLQAHHLDNIESLVNGVTKRVAKLTRRKKFYPWEVDDKVELKKIALAVGHAWSEYNIESMLKMAVDTNKDFRKCVGRLGLSDVLITKLLKIGRKMWLETGLVDASVIFEYDIGFNRDWVAKWRSEINFLGILIVNKLYFEDLFGVFGGEKKMKSVLKSVALGAYPGVVKMIDGHRMLGFRYVMFSAENPSGEVLIDRGVDGLCESAGVDREYGLHCTIPSINPTMDRNSTTLAKLARLGVDGIESKTLGENGLEEVRIGAASLWQLLEKYEWR